VASTDGSATVWDVGAKTRIAQIATGEVLLQATFVSDEQYLVTISQNGNVIKWDLSWLEAGDSFAIACRRLANDLEVETVKERYGVEIAVPICGRNRPHAIDTVVRQ
jgi:hypothetical protein